MKLPKKIVELWEDYQEKEIKISGKPFNQYETLKRIRLYKNSQFYGEVDETAIFWNLSSNRVLHFAKNIELDTKDFECYGVNNTSYLQAWTLNIRFKKWARDHGFHITLNDLSEGLATYGSSVWKKVKEDGTYTIQEVDLEKLAFDPSVKSIDKSPYFIEQHFLTESELREKSDVWDNVEELIAKQKKEKKEETGDNFYEVLEFYGEIEEDDEIKEKHLIISPMLLDEILYEEDKKAFPYYDFHISRYEGRWLRVGAVERLFKLQERTNKLVNENAATTEIASLLLLRSSDPNLKGNVLRQLESGDILNSVDIQQIPMDNRFINGFITELREIELKADKLCLTPDIVQGAQLPSGTPFRGMAVLNNAATNAFKIPRENVGEKIAKILIEDILPQFTKKWNTEEILRIGGDDVDIEEYNNLMLEKATRMKLLNAGLMGMGTEEMATLSMMDEDNILEQASKKPREITHGKDYFNFDFGIRINATNESTDKSQQNDAYSNAIQWAISHPAVVGMPLFRQYLENNGIRWTKLKMALKQELQQGGQTPAEPKQDKLMSMVNTNE